jgi:hypothetical protein
MSTILLRNQLTDTEKYKVTDVALTSVSYDAARNETTLNIPSTDSRHDAVSIGQHIIPMRKGNPFSNTAGYYSLDILHPEQSLRIINKITGTAERKLVLQGDQRDSFPGGTGLGIAGNGSPEGYNQPINVSKIVRNRKYRIVTTGETTWKYFGNLHNNAAEASQDSKLASIGTTFIAKSSGTSTISGEADSPIFDTGPYFNGIGGTDLSYTINSTGITAGRETADVIGRYDKVTPYLYQNESSDIVIQKIGATDNNTTGRWTIWNRSTGKIYFEDKMTTSLSTYRFDSPSLDSTVATATDLSYRPNIGDIPSQAPVIAGSANSPRIEWNDRTVSVPTQFQYTTFPDSAGTVIEVAHVSSMFGLNRPLSNTDIDGNFSHIENNKLASDGSQPVEGNLIINGNLSSQSADISNQIVVGGAEPFSSNTGLTLGDKDLEVNNIRLSGTINDDALFKTYGIVGFPHSFIADYNPKYSGIEPVTILYFSNVSDISAGDSISTLGNSKTGRVRRVNSEYNYVQVSEINATNKFVVGDTISGKTDLGPILRVLNPEDYLKVGQNLRIFGINQKDEPLKTYTNHNSPNHLIFSISTPSAPLATGRFELAGSRTFSYKIALFDTLTGKITGFSAESVVTQAANIIDWDKNNYIQLTNIARRTANDLILIYRKSNDEATHHLIDIIGNEDIGTDLTSLTHNDYGAFNKPQWSKINNTGYFYTADAGIVYVPINEGERQNVGGTSGTSKTTLPYVGDGNKYSRGFLDTRVASGMINPKLNLSASPAYFRITETAFCNGPTNGYSLSENRLHDSPNIQLNWYDYQDNFRGFNSPLASDRTANPVKGQYGSGYGKINEIEFFIDNSRMVDGPDSGITGGIQKLIQDKIAEGTRSVRLPGGVYHSKLITLPSDFKFQGASDRNTAIKSIPWLDDALNTKTIYGGNVSKIYGNFGNTTANDTFGISKTYQKKQALDFYPETITGEIGTTSTLSDGVSRFFNAVPQNTKLSSSFGIFANVFGGQKAYARAVLEFDGKDNVEVSDIRLDGNVINQSVVQMNLTGKSNFTVSGQLSKNISLKNVSIADNVLGGFYGEEISEGIIEGSIVKNGGTVLSTSNKAAGLYMPGSSRIRLTSNVIENFSNANDLTSNSNTTLVGNIVRDTGSGILAYATSNFIHEGNLILGPADEYIPVVDTLNSEYDQLNINLVTESGAGVGDFISDTIQFLRDNSPLDLRPNDANRPNKIDQVGISLTTTIRTMVGLGTQTYFLPDDVNGIGFNYSYGASTNTAASGYIIQPNTEVEDGTITLANGNLSYKIPQSKIQALKAAAGFDVLSTRYNSLTSRPTGEQLIGLVYDVSGIEYLYMENDGDIIKWTKIEVDDTLDAQTIKFTIDGNYANLFAIGDKIIFTSGADSSSIRRADNFSTSLISPVKDANGNDMYLPLPVKGKNLINASTAEIIVGISNDDGFTSSQRDGISAGSFDVGGLTPTKQNECRLGIQNTFSITRGRIVI